MSATVQESLLLAKKPTLHFTESAFAAAFDRLNDEDPELRLSPEQEQEVLAQWVNVDGVVERRDEFARFVIALRSMVEGKRKEGETILVQAAKLAVACERMEQAALRTMKALGAKALQGGAYLLKAKVSPGAVEIVDSAQVPEEFFRVKEDQELTIVRELVKLLEEQSRRLWAMELDSDEADVIDAALDEDGDVKRARFLLEGMTLERRAVDKKLVQAEWKAHGETIETSDAVTGEITERPLIPGVRKEVTTKLVIE